LDPAQVNQAELETTWKEYLMKKINCTKQEQFQQELIGFLQAKNPQRSLDTCQKFYQALAWFGLLNSGAKIPITQSVLDSICVVLSKCLVYGPGERDMVCLHHSFEIDKGRGNKVIRISRGYFRKKEHRP
jgi:alpha-aminoadipic semialdehyde synthase